MFPTCITSQNIAELGELGLLMITLSPTILLFIIVIRKRSLGGHRNVGCPSVRPTCKRDILRTVSQPTSNLKYDITPKIWLLLIMGHQLKTR